MHSVTHSRDMITHFYINCSVFNKAALIFIDVSVSLPWTFRYHVHNSFPLVESVASVSYKVRCKNRMLSLKFNAVTTVNWDIGPQSPILTAAKLDALVYF